jgi:hypothetical protein
MVSALSKYHAIAKLTANIAANARNSRRHREEADD